MLQRFLAFCALFLIVSPVSAFQDTDSKAIDRLVNKGVIAEKNYFHPDVPCTRGQFVMWAMRNAGYELEGQRISEPFSDVSAPQAYAPYIGKAWQEEVLTTKNEFHPQTAITTLDALSILLNLENVNLPQTGSDLNFRDAPKTLEGKLVMKKALEMGLIREKNNGLLGTYFSLNRYECAKMIDAVSIKKGFENIEVTIEANVHTPQNSEEKVLTEVIEILEDKYLHRDDIDPEVLVEEAIRHVVDSLGDKHTVYFDENEVNDFLMSVGEGEQYGIGSQVGLDELGRVQIVKPLRGSPAEAAGLQPGDVVFKVDGIDVISAGMTLEEVVAFIKGPEGSDVEIIFLRRGKELPVTITRAKIQPSSVHHSIHDGYLVIEIDYFGGDTEEIFLAAIQNNPVAASKGIIIDLRNNPGGFLQTAVDLLSHILPSNSVAVQTRAIDSLHRETVRGPADVATMPMLVLVNSRSASASEILAGAVQDNNRAAVIGTTTYGKGTAQQLLSLSNGSALKVTISEWLTPNDRNIDGVGITPDFIFEDIDSGNDVYDFAARTFQRNQWKPLGE